jgi:hypothetical protein
MKEQTLLYLDKLKHKVSKILAFTIVIYGVCIIVLYQYYQDKAEIEKAQILQNYYNKIVKVSTNKINSLTQQISGTLQSNNISISTNGSDFKICCDKCINYNLFHFGALIDKYIPEFIFYKIELNKKFLYSNIKAQNYQIEKIYHLNDYNQFSISLAIDKLYWSKTEAEIKKPFWIMTLFALVNILLFEILSKILFKNFNKEYTLHYQNKYKEELDQLKFDNSKELKSCKDLLMNKIWNLNFNKQKDLEINILLAGEANKIALIDEGDNDQENMIKGSRLKNSSDKVPCSIVLYQDDKIEEINIDQLIELFTDRFDQEDENISVNIISKVKVVYFASKASLYQIIYSLINYLIFVIKKQSPTAKHNIRLIIDDIEKVIQLHFEYDGFPITEEKELLKMSSSFFKTHANPFVLNINQVFNILRINGFDCSVSYNQLNIIDILRKKQKDNRPITTEDNIILLSSFTEKKK